MSLAAVSMRHARGVVFLAVFGALAGAYLVTRTAKGVYPELVFAREQVVATVPGASAEMIEVSATRPLEQALVSIPGVERVRSRTIRGAAEVSLYFTEGTDMDQAHPLVLSRLAELRSSLPPDADLTAERVLTSAFPILSFNVAGPYPPARLYEVAQYTVRPALSGLPGAGTVTVQSSDIPETEVLLEPARLTAAHLTVGEVAKRLAAANAVTSAARLDDAHELVLGIVSGQLADAAAVADVVVGGTDTAPVRVRDLGTVVDGVQPARSVVRVDGRPGAIVNVTRRVGGDILVLDRAAEDAIARLRPSLPEGVTVTPVYEQATFVSDAVAGVRDAVIFGCLLVVAILAVFLRDWRSTALAAAALPLTVGLTLLALKVTGQTLNLMTLGGIAVAVGLVIDDAVVVIEAVHRHLEAGRPPAEAARRGTEELFWPVVGTTLTTVVVFLPLGLLTGVPGQFFGALSVALASAVLLSLVVALTVLPAVAAWFLRPLRRPHRPDLLENAYVRLLDGGLRHRWIVIGSALFAICLGAFLFSQVETGFLPEADEGAYVVDYFAPVGASLDEANAMAAQIEEIIARTPEVQSFSRRLGAELGPSTATLSSSGDVSVRLKANRHRGVEAIMDEQREEIARRVPGVRVEFIQILADQLGDLEGAPEPIEVEIFGPDPAVLRTLVAQVSDRLADAPGLVDIYDGDPGCTPERVLQVSPLQAARAGLGAAEVGDQLAGKFLGNVATELRLPDHLQDVRVRLAPPATAPVQAFDGAQVLGASAEPVPVSALGALTDRCPPAERLRDNQRNMVHFTARIAGTSLGAASAEIRTRLEGLSMPEAYHWELAGLSARQSESFRSLAMALVLAVVSVLAVLLFQLRSFLRAAIVLAATPIGLVGGVLVLLLTRTPLNLPAVMGAILLIGLVVKNGILLLDHVIAAEGAGATLDEAIRKAARTRLRPILMTTLATLVALLPLALGVGAGSAMHQPLALFVLGGLALSTSATLLWVPVLLSWRRTTRRL